MTNKEILEIALEQSAVDCSCSAEDFLQAENRVVLSKPHRNARKYLPLPLECDLVSYGNNIVAQVSERLAGIVSVYIEKYPVEHCFETPNINALNDALAAYDLKVCFMAEYFLPDLTQLKELPCEFETRILHKGDFSDLYTEEWSNALSSENRGLDVLGVGATITAG